MYDIRKSNTVSPFRRIFVLVSLVLLISSCRLDVSTDKKDSLNTETITEKEALDLLHRWTEAYLQGDADALENILDDSWLYSGSADGKTTNKHATIEEFSSADYKFEDITYENLEVDLYGAIAVVRGSETMVIVGNSGKDTTQLSLRFTDVYQKKDGEIRAISTHSSPVEEIPDQSENALTKTAESGFTDDLMEEFQWMNRPESHEINDGALRITATKGTDFFNNPEDNSSTSSAPFLYKEIKGDFVVRALVRPDFASQWNAVALMVYVDDNNWIKFAFENSDATGNSIVSVVTRNLSDDSNGVILNDLQQVWLKIVRKDNNFAMLWSKDGKDFKMARLTTLPEFDSVKIGIEAQSPIGESAVHEILNFDLERTRVKDMRKGI